MVCQLVQSPAKVVQMWIYTLRGNKTTLRSTGWRLILLSLFLHLITWQPPTRGTSGIPLDWFSSLISFNSSSVFSSGAGSLDNADSSITLFFSYIMVIKLFKCCGNYRLCCSKILRVYLSSTFISQIVYWSLNWKHKTKIIIASQKVYNITKLGDIIYVRTVVIILSIQFVSSLSDYLQWGK